MRVILQSICALLLSVVLMTQAEAKMIRVVGNSMKPEISSGDFLLYQPFGDKTPNRFDRVVVKYPGRGDELFISRIIGLENETVQWEANQLLIDGELVQQDFEHNSNTMDFGPVTIPAEHFFVAGDFRSSSVDSRLDQIGSLANDMLVGLIIEVLHPDQDRMKIFFHAVDNAITP